MRKPKPVLGVSDLADAARRWLAGGTAHRYLRWGRHLGGKGSRGGPWAGPERRGGHRGARGAVLGLPGLLDVRLGDRDDWVSFGKVAVSIAAVALEDRHLVMPGFVASAWGHRRAGKVVTLIPAGQARHRLAWRKGGEQATGRGLGRPRNLAAACSGGLGCVVPAITADPRVCSTALLHAAHRRSYSRTHPGRGRRAA